MADPRRWLATDAATDETTEWQTVTPGARVGVDMARDDGERPVVVTEKSYGREIDRRRPGLRETMQTWADRMKAMAKGPQGEQDDRPKVYVSKDEQGRPRELVTYLPLANGGGTKRRARVVRDMTTGTVTAELAGVPLRVVVMIDPRGSITSILIEGTSYRLPDDFVAPIMPADEAKWPLATLKAQDEEARAALEEWKAQDAALAERADLTPTEREQAAVRAKLAKEMQSRVRAGPRPPMDPRERARQDVSASLQRAVDAGLMTEQVAARMILAGGLNNGRLERKDAAAILLAAAEVAAEAGAVGPALLRSMRDTAALGVTFTLDRLASVAGLTMVQEQPANPKTNAGTTLDAADGPETASQIDFFDTKPAPVEPTTGPLDEDALRDLASLARRVLKGEVDERVTSVMPYIPAMAERIEDLEGILREALTAEPCHASAHRDVHQTTTTLCSVQLESMAARLLSVAMGELDVIDMPRRRHLDPEGNVLPCCQRDGNVGTWVAWGRTLDPNVGFASDKARRGDDRPSPFPPDIEQQDDPPAALSRRTKAAFKAALKAEAEKAAEAKIQQRVEREIQVAQEQAQAQVAQERAQQEANAAMQAQARRIVDNLTPEQRALWQQGLADMKSMEDAQRQMAWQAQQLSGQAILQGGAPALTQAELEAWRDASNSALSLAEGAPPEPVDPAPRDDPVGESVTFKDGVGTLTVRPEGEMLTSAKLQEIAATLKTTSGLPDSYYQMAPFLLQGVPVRWEDGYIQQSPSGVTVKSVRRWVKPDPLQTETGNAVEYARSLLSEKLGQKLNEVMLDALENGPSIRYRRKLTRAERVKLGEAAGFKREPRKSTWLEEDGQRIAWLRAEEEARERQQRKERERRARDDWYARIREERERREEDELVSAGFFAVEKAVEDIRFQAAVSPFPPDPSLDDLPF